MKQSWQMWRKGVSEDFCEEIKSRCENIHAKDGTIFGIGNDENQIRNSKVRWILDKDIKDLMMGFATDANRSFGVDITGLWDMQFTEYHGEENGFYDWHHDVDWTAHGPCNRKITVVIQLDDPESYEGGAFEFKEVETPSNFTEKGSVLVFPSYFVHRVLPVTKGLRRSLVGWIEGPSWR